MFEDVTEEIEVADIPQDEVEVNDETEETEIELQDLNVVFRETQLNSLEFANGSIVYGGGVARFEGNFTYTTTNAPTQRRTITGFLDINIQGSEDIVVDADAEDVGLQIKLDETTKSKIDNAITVAVNNLQNYYLKTETYTKEEVNALIGTQLHFEIVEELPTEEISTTTIYLLRVREEAENIYDEYIYINNLWEKIGTTAIDLSNYYTKNEADGKFALITQLSNYQEKITTSNKLSATLVEESVEKSFISNTEKAEWSAKQDAISDLGTIRSNAESGKGASDTISTYGDVVTHNANEFASSSDIVQSDWNETDDTSKAYIKNKPTIPEGSTLYQQEGQNTDGAMSQKATTDALNGIRDSIPTNTSDLTNDSGFITLEDIPAIPTKTSELDNDSGFITNEYHDSSKQDQLTQSQLDATNSGITRSKVEEYDAVKNQYLKNATIGTDNRITFTKQDDTTEVYAGNKRGLIAVYTTSEIKLTANTLTKVTSSVGGATLLHNVGNKFTFDGQNIVIGSGIAFIRVYFKARFYDNASQTRFTTTIKVNGSEITGAYPTDFTDEIKNSQYTYKLMTGSCLVPVQQGDLITWWVRSTQSNASNKDALQTNSVIEVEVVYEN